MSIGFGFSRFLCINLAKRLKFQSAGFFRIRMSLTTEADVIMVTIPPGDGFEVIQGCAKEDKGCLDSSTALVKEMVAKNVNEADVEKSCAEINMSKRAFKRMKRRQLKEAAKEAKLHTIGSAPVQQFKQKSTRELQESIDLIDEKCFKETDYYFENGLRKVYPYHYDFTAHAKGRWFEQKLVDVFVREFQNYSLEQCIKSIEAGRVTVNGKPTNVDHVIKNGDFVTNRVHRHELPVTDEPIEILVDNADVLVVSKPSSIPVHPCGRYRHNSLLYILAKDYGYNNLRGLYRLDRLTSGLLIFGRTEAKTSEMMRHIKDRLVEKEYVCRVDGLFPDGKLACEEAIGPLSEKLGIYRATPVGKESKTTFTRLSYNGRTSVVKCKPHTGRTHQIRVHLQYLGYPIINDPVYTGDVWGHNRGRFGDFGRPDDLLLADLTQRHSSSHYLDRNDALYAIETTEGLGGPACPPGHSSLHAPPSTSPGQLSLTPPNAEIDDGAPLAKKHKSDVYGSNEERKKKAEEKQLGFEVERIEAGPQRLCVEREGKWVEPKRFGLDSSRIVFDKDCKECRAKYIELQPDQLTMYLHAYSYKGPDWEYSTPMPAWAQEDWMKD